MEKINIFGIVTGIIVGITACLFSGLGAAEEDDADTVRTAIAVTKETATDYWQKCLRQRLACDPMHAGSFFTAFKTPEELEKALTAAHWVEVIHPNVAEPCRCFMTTDIPSGVYGMADISELSEDVALVCDDRKSTGEICGLVVAGIATSPRHETYLIAGDDGDGLMAFTFHPGEPAAHQGTKELSPEMAERLMALKPGDTLSKSEALALGFEEAKIADEAKAVTM